MVFNLIKKNWNYIILSDREIFWVQLKNPKENGHENWFHVLGQNPIVIVLVFVGPKEIWLSACYSIDSGHIYCSQLYICSVKISIRRYTIVTVPSCVATNNINTSKNIIFSWPFYNLKKLSHCVAYRIISAHWYDQVTQLLLLLVLLL